VGGVSQSHGSTLSPTKPYSVTQRRSSRTAAIGLSSATDARPAKRPGCAATHPATSSLEMSAPSRGNHHALSSPKPTPAPSIASSVASIGTSPVGIAPPVQRRSDAKMSCSSVVSCN
jgi:hypothetical protein